MESSNAIALTILPLNTFMNDGVKIELKVTIIQLCVMATKENVCFDKDDPNLEPPPSEPHLSTTPHNNKRTCSKLISRQQDELVRNIKNIKTYNNRKNRL